MIQTPRRILLTGFGVFPGMSENISGEVAMAAAKHVSRQLAVQTVRCEILPVVWHTADRLVTQLVEAERPDLVVHFGVSRMARGLELERQAVARWVCAPDAAGRDPLGRILSAPEQQLRFDHKTLEVELEETRASHAPPRSVRRDGPMVLRSQLPVSRLAHRLRLLGVPARASSDAGRYLCNAVYYHSLLMAHRSDHRFDALFVHLPAGQHHPPSSHQRLLHGAECLMDELVGGP